MAPDAPMTPTFGVKNDRRPPPIPASIYSQMKCGLVKRSSTRGPKRYNEYMLNRMCVMLRGSCRNMYVTSVHGRVRRSAGTSSSQYVTAGTKNCNPNITMLAMSRRRTQGVIHVEWRRCSFLAMTPHPVSEFIDHLDRVHERTRRIVVLIPSNDIEWAPKSDWFSLGGL